MAVYRAPAEWEEWGQWLAAGLHGRSRWRLLVIMGGILFAQGRRTVTTWLRAAGVSHDYQDYYFFLRSVGCRCQTIIQQLWALLLPRILTNPRVLLVLDDSPTRRYGPKVQGAGHHHDPAPGPTDQQFLYGHVWVTLAVSVRHPQWGTLGLPVASRLYVRKDDVPALSRRQRWTFQTKLELAGSLVQQAAAVLQRAGKAVWVVSDGAYTKRPFVRAAQAAGVTLVGRLRKDAALRDLPPRETKPRRGRKRMYGLHRLSLVKRAAHPHGWQEVEAMLYGVTTTKIVKTFLATHPTFGGVVRVVIVREPEGPQFFYCTATDASVTEILEAFADRAAIEQVFHDVKEIWGSGQQQVRNVWANIGVWHLDLWMHALTELWAWARPARQLRDRRDSPWDTASRRPSHADRRKALQAAYLQAEFNRGAAAASLPRKIRTLLQRLLRIAA